MSLYASSNDVVQAWVSAVNAKDVDKILSLYDEASILLPTFSPHTLRTLADRRHYFEVLGSRPGFGVSLHEKTVRVQVLGAGHEVISGIYRFHMDIDEEPLVFEARFSFVVDLSKAAPIINHHSSQIPRTLN